MKKYIYSFAGLVLAASAAHAQTADDQAAEPPAPEASASAEPATPAEAAEPATPADPAAGAAAVPAEPATPAAPAASANVDATVEVSEADIDSFAKATVKLQAIQADTAIPDDQKQTAMAAAVSEVGLNPAKYNAIGQAAQSDSELRAKVQTAMSKYAAPHPSDG
jgi:hypothetical protein